MTSSTWRDLLANARKAMVDAREILVPTSQVQPMRGQPRTYFEAGSLQRLADSMQQVGQIYPGLVRSIPTNGSVRYELLDGERRWRAAKLRGLMYRALLVKVDDAASSFLIAATANFNREAHTPIEVCDAIGEMNGLGMPIAEIASVLGLHEIWATNIYGLRRLIPDVRALLDPSKPREQQLPVTAAIQISKVDGSLQLALARKVIAKTVSLRALRGEAIRASRAAKLPSSHRPTEPRHQWKALSVRASLLARTTRDVTALLGNVDQTRPVIAGRDLAPVLKNLRAAANDATRLAEHLERAQRRKGAA